MRRVCWNVCALGALLSLFGCGGGSHSTSSGNQTVGAIVAGVSIDSIHIGDPFARVSQRYGDPDTGDIKLGYVIVGWERLGLSVGGIDANLNRQFDADEVCQGLAAFAPYAGKTEKGIGLGSTRAAVRASYGIPDDDTATNDKYLALGIAFVYASDATDASVAQIVVFPAGSTVPTVAASIAEGETCRNNR